MRIVVELFELARSQLIRSELEYSESGIHSNVRMNTLGPRTYFYQETTLPYTK